MLKRTLSTSFMMLLLGILLCLPALAAAGQRPGEKELSPGVTQPLTDLRAVTATGVGGAEFAPHRALVQFRPGVSLTTARSIASRVGGRVAREISRCWAKDGSRLVVVQSTTQTTDELVKQLSADPAVAYAEPDFVVHAEAIPNDPRWSELWGMAKIGAPSAWDLSTGSSSIVIADIDTGVAYDHQDLAANMWQNPGEIPGNATDDDGNGYVDDVYGIDPANGDSDPYDDHGHGTHTSGTAAGVGNNSKGVAGVCWTARVMALKFLDAGGSGYDSDAIECINYVIWQKNHGVNVVAINASWGGAGYNTSLRNAINAAGDAGIVFCAAAGNDGVNNDATPHYPSSYDCANIVSVAATDQNDAKAGFSNWGATSVDLAAPGVDILSTVPGDSFTMLPGGPFYDTMEAGSAAWTAQSPWAITTERSQSPTHSWSDSPGGDYVDNQDTAIVTRSIDLSALPGPDAFGFSVNGAAEYGYDYLDVDFSNDGGSTWTNVGSLTGDSGGDWYQFHWDIPASMRVANFKARLRLVTDFMITDDGYYIDDVGFGDLVAGDSYESWPGTSMATPHVAGAVALCAARFPSETVAQRVQRILANVDPVSAMSGKCVTGGRLNVAKALNPVPSDTTAPTTSATGIPSGWVNHSVGVGLSASDAGGSGVAYTEYSLDGAPYQHGTGVTVSGTGQHTLLYRSKDNAGNLESAKSATIRIETTLPTTRLLNLTTTGWVNHNVTLTLQASDDRSGVQRTEYKLGAGAWTAYAGPITITGEGENLLSYRSVDNAGNTEVAQTATVRIDKTGPLTRATRKLTVKRKKKAVFRFRVDDRTAKAKVVIKIYKGKKLKKQLKGVGWKATNSVQKYSWRTCTLKKGTYIWKVYATDEAGNVQSKMVTKKLVVK